MLELVILMIPIGFFSSVHSSRRRLSGDIAEVVDVRSCVQESMVRQIFRMPSSEPITQSIKWSTGGWQGPHTERKREVEKEKSKHTPTQVGVEHHLPSKMA